ncbi:hypothetical protein [Qingshengfaniella alkalisoli]|uniref:Uncharacterized protein n=1 Tax=Qingshengfaniella alkalisoli TaxID=2599296 RepID=A0A5B8ITR9_9RHOB|nr:hypothetical protein [Qingshengfaniella alkalisoli]QDY68863.1 hypothetical protein FPZ52_03935 [Qingshengfaniella alkalisoli]
MDTETSDEPLAVVQPSGPRRIFATAVLFSVSALLLILAVVTPPSSAGWLIYLLVCGGVALWLTLRLWQATHASIILTRDALSTSDGTHLCNLSDVAGLDRGVFAFKPSNGFVVRLKRKAPRGWAPGLWWRVGKRVGIGGVTSAGQAKFMAEMLAAQIVENTENSIK